MRKTAHLFSLCLAGAVWAQAPAVTPAAPSDEPRPSERVKATSKKDDADGPSRGNPARSASGGIAVSETMRLAGFDLFVSVFDSSGVYFGPEGYTNALSLWLEPSFALGKRFFAGRWAEGFAVSLRVPIEVELTGNDPRFRGTGFAGPAPLSAPEGLPVATQLQPAFGLQDGLTRAPLLLGDTWLSLAHGSVAQIPVALVDVSAGLRLELPTAVATRNSGLITALSLGTSLDRTLGPVALDYTVRGTKYFFASPVTSIVPRDEPVQVNGRLEPVWHPGSTTVANADWGLFHGPAVTVTLPYGFSAAVTYLLFHTRPFALPSGCTVPGVPLADVCVDTVAVADSRGAAWRVDHWFQVSADWKKGPVTVSLGLSTYRPLFSLDGQVAQPFAESNRNNYTTVYLSLSSSVEAVLDAAYAKKEQP